MPSTFKIFSTRKSVIAPWWAFICDDAGLGILREAKTFLIIISFNPSVQLLIVCKKSVVSTPRSRTSFGCIDIGITPLLKSSSLAILKRADLPIPYDQLEF